MQVAQPPRRHAATKATTNLAENSSGEGSDTDKESNDYHATPRVRKSKSKRDNAKTKAHARKRSSVTSQDVDAALTGTIENKRKRGTTAGVGTRRKRQRGITDTRSGLPAGEDDGSDLTPLSSSSEDVEVKHSTRPLVKFPMQLTPSASSSKPRKPDQTLSTALPLPEISDLDDDSDDLPDIGTVLSQQALSTRTGKKRQKPPMSSRKQKYQSQRTLSQDASPFSFASSPTLPPTLPPPSLPLSLNHNHIDDDATTETNFSDHLGASDLSGDSDLELDAVPAGELCFAKGKAADTVYWPAKVLQAKRPTSGRRKGKQKKMYRIIFLDKKEKDIPRDFFYISSQEEFCTCTVGQFESSHIDVVNDIEEDARQSNNSTTGRHRKFPSRSPSPISVPNPPLLSGSDFCDLLLHHQLPYVTPILRAIMNEEATWALRRHEMYLKGGAARHKLMNEGGLRGAVDAKSVDDLLGLVEKWCLGVRGRNFVGDRDEDVRADDQLQDAVPERGREEDAAVPISTGSGSEANVSEAPSLHGASVPESEQQDALPKVMEDPTYEAPPSETGKAPESEITTEPNSPAPPPPTQPTVVIEPEVQALHQLRVRQRGSPGYEKLSPLEKVNYCLEVLLPEALNQILLWRIAERKSVEVMWDNVEKEQRLHERGEELLRETDWVMDVMRLRKAMASINGKSENTKSEMEGTLKGKTKALKKTRSGRNMIGSYKE